MINMIVITEKGDSIRSNRVGRFIVVVFLVSIILTACGATPQDASTNAPVGEGGVEDALVIFSDVAQGFAISHPGTWSQDTPSTSGVKFIGGDD